MTFQHAYPIPTVRLLFRFIALSIGDLGLWHSYKPYDSQVDSSDYQFAIAKAMALSIGFNEI